MFTLVHRPVVRYGNESSAQGCMNVRFNTAGNRLLALRRRLPPVLYAVDSSTHLCQFDHPGYYNSCTMKSCCFAGDNDEYVLSGKRVSLNTYGIHGILGEALLVLVVIVTFQLVTLRFRRF